MSTIAVLGSGYVGLTTAVCLAQLGHNVVATDRDERRIELLSRGESPILEESLDDLLSDVVRKGRLVFITDNRLAVQKSEFVFFCLPTPQGSDGSADLSAVVEVIEEIRSDVQANSIVVMKSTVPIGTSKTVIKLLDRSDIHYVSNPEFLREGRAIKDFFNPDRIVLGSESSGALERMESLYEGISSVVQTMDATSAETVKYASNSFLSVKLSFVNDISWICEKVGANIVHVSTAMGLDTRIGSKFLEPGPGWGGSCFPKDTRALLALSEEHGFSFSLLHSAIRSNDEHQVRIARKILDAVPAEAIDPVIAVLGLTFKAGTDDLRESPALKIVDFLQEAGATVQAFDPAVPSKENIRVQGTPRICSSAVEAARGASVLAILTEWPDFKRLDPVSIGTQMRHRMIIDARNMFTPKNWHEAGFVYRGLGNL